MNEKKHGVRAIICKVKFLRGSLKVKFLLLCFLGVLAQAQLQNNRLMLVNLDSLQKSPIIDQKYQEIYSLYYDDYEIRIRHSIKKLEKNIDLCINRGGHIDPARCVEEELREKLRNIERYTFSLSCIKQIIDCHFEFYLVEVVLKDYIYENYPNAFVINSSTLRYHPISDKHKIFITDELIANAESRILKDEVLSDVLTNLDDEIIDLMKRFE